MELGPVFYVISGIWGMAMVLNLITATRICYLIEERSGKKTSLPAFANVLPVAFNYGVAQDEETQELRRQMNRRLLYIVAGFIAFFIFLRLWTNAQR